MISNPILQVLACSMAGFLVKYIDEVRDEAYFGGRFVRTATILCTLAIVMGSFSSASRLFFVSISIGCFFARKLDIPEFRFLAAVAVVMTLAINLSKVAIDSMPTVLIWSSIAYVDERLNSLSSESSSPFLKRICYLKPLYILGSVITALLLNLNSILFFCVIGFDVSYYLVLLAKERLRTIDPIFFAGCFE